MRTDRSLPRIAGTSFVAREAKRAKRMERGLSSGREPIRPQSRGWFRLSCGGLPQYEERDCPIGIFIRSDGGGSAVKEKREACIPHQRKAGSATARGANPEPHKIHPSLPSVRTLADSIPFAARGSRSQGGDSQVSRSGQNGVGLRPVEDLILGGEEPGKLRRPSGNGSVR